MKTNLHRYRLAGIVGGLLLAAGQFYGPLCVLQLVALMPLMCLVLRERRVLPVLLTGFYMGMAYTLPQMIYLCMPVPVTVILLLWLSVILLGLSVGIAYLLPRHPVLGPLAVGALWYLLDWINYTAVPIWGMAQSFARSWTAYPFTIQFISITSITGVVFVIGVLQGIAAWYLVYPEKRKPCIILTAIILITLISINTVIWTEKSCGSLRVAAAGWIFDDKENSVDPHKTAGFDQLFEQPAKEAAAQGARVFNTGEMGFYIAEHERDAWMKRFSRIARQNDLWLVVGYFNLGANSNRVFFMNPDGEIVHEYTKTHKTPFEPGIKGTGDLKTVDIDGVTVGAMICHDDNYSDLTRRYGRLKADVVLCPTMDWRTVNTPHFQAVKARAIEGNYAIARGAVGGTSAAIGPKGTVLTKNDHYQNGPGLVVADVPIRKRQTLFARFGHWPILAASGILVSILSWFCRRKGHSS
ncbi:MAG: nitrilase-related carbon-nitrogen hydrolase [Planctomycetota bacterium]|jgi:apolipoprotein N-acyltransferase